MNILNLIAQTITLLPLVMSGDTVQPLAIHEDGSYTAGVVSGCLHGHSCDTGEALYDGYGTALTSTVNQNAAGETFSFSLVGVAATWVDGEIDEKFADYTATVTYFSDGSTSQSYNVNDNVAIMKVDNGSGTACAKRLDGNYDFDRPMYVDGSGNFSRHKGQPPLGNVCDGNGMSQWIGAHTFETIQSGTRFSDTIFTIPNTETIVNGSWLLNTEDTDGAGVTSFTHHGTVDGVRYMGSYHAYSNGSTGQSIVVDPTEYTIDTNTMYLVYNDCVKTIQTTHNLLHVDMFGNYAEYNGQSGNVCG